MRNETLFYDSVGYLRGRWLILICILAIAALFVCMIGGMLLITKSSCNQYALLNPEMDFAWRFWGGCLVRYEGVYVPYSKLIGILSS